MPNCERVRSFDGIPMKIVKVMGEDVNIVKIISKAGEDMGWYTDWALSDDGELYYRDSPESVGYEVPWSKYDGYRVPKVSFREMRAIVDAFGPLMAFL